MEEHKITSREVLKTYFEKGDYPTQDQFAELIDSLKHKEDIPTNKEAVMTVNSLASIRNAYLSYVDMYLGVGKYSLLIRSKDEEDQIISINGNRDGIYNERKIYFFGNAPYFIKLKGDNLEELKEYEYFYLNFQAGPNNIIQRLFGNNFLDILNEFEIGTFEDNTFSFQLQKINLGNEIKIVKTNVKFINKTNIPIRYRSQSNYWGSNYTDQNTVTNHYDFSDYLYFYYRADLTKATQHIVCQVYNEDTGELLVTGYLYAGENNLSNWGGGYVYAVRNVRIECNYQDNQNNQINFR